MEVTVLSLWLPILLSTVAIFFLSFAMWMVLPHHKSDWTAVPDEDAVMDTLRSQGVQRGQYVIPCGDMKDPEFIKKAAAGPSGMLIIRPSGGFNMGKSLGQSFAYNLAIAFVVAYVASFTLSSASDGEAVFRLTSTVAFLTCAGALGWGPIWWSRTWSSTLKEMLDGAVYSLAVGTVFTLLW